MKLLRIDKFNLILMFLSIVVMLGYLWGSQYYQPSNYTSTTGIVSGSPTMAGGRGDSNYTVNFQTNSGQKVSYIYQVPQPSSWFVQLSSGQVLKLSYNESNPKQVKVKPLESLLVGELAFSLLIVPVGALILANRIRRQSQ